VDGLRCTFLRLGPPGHPRVGVTGRGLLENLLLTARWLDIMASMDL